MYLLNTYNIVIVKQSSTFDFPRLVPIITV